MTLTSRIKPLKIGTYGRSDRLLDVSNNIASAKDCLFLDKLVLLYYNIISMKDYVNVRERIDRNGSDTH